MVPPHPPRPVRQGGSGAERPARRGGRGATTRYRPGRGRAPRPGGREQPDSSVPDAPTPDATGPAPVPDATAPRPAWLSAVSLCQRLATAPEPSRSAAPAGNPGWSPGHSISLSPGGRRVLRQCFQRMSLKTLPADSCSPAPRRRRLTRPCPAHPSPDLPEQPRRGHAPASSSHAATTRPRRVHSPASGSRLARTPAPQLRSAIGLSSRPYGRVASTVRHRTRSGRHRAQPHCLVSRPGSPSSASRPPAAV
jgi:hypothetical protein